MPIINKGTLLAINGAADEGILELNVYEATRSFNWDDAFNACVKHATIQEIKADHHNYYDGELYIAEWLCAEGCLKRVPTPQHLITITGNEYTFNK